MHTSSFQHSAVLFAESLVTFQHLQSEHEVEGTLSLMMGVDLGAV